MTKPKIYADFHNADSEGRLRLNCVGTIEDLAREGVKLQDGLELSLYTDDLDDQDRLDQLMVDGVVSYSDDEHCWVATIDWSAIRHASENRAANGVLRQPANRLGEAERAANENLR